MEILGVSFDPLYPRKKLSAVAICNKWTKPKTNTKTIS